MGVTSGHKGKEVVWGDVRTQGGGGGVVVTSGHKGKEAVWW